MTNKYSLLCLLNDKELKLARKNPHTVQFFCEIDNIIDCNKNNCKNKKGYRYQREFADNILEKTNIKRKDIEKLYFQDEIQETLNEYSKKISYLPRKQRLSSVIHWGQLKLFLSTLQFLLFYAPRSEKVHVIYPGSAIGYNIDILTKLFPQCYWYLIDPNPFFEKLKDNPKIVEIRNEYFTNELAEYYKDLLKNEFVLFISDIRTNTEESEIRENNKWQEEWVKIINPEYSQLKFRIPRDRPDYDYLKGIIYLQIYPPQASTETRLVVKKNAKNIKYNLEDYENKLYFHNRVLRACSYENEHNIKIRGMDSCYDCTSFINLLIKYKYKYRKIEKRKIKDIVKFIIHNLRNYNRLEVETKKMLRNFVN
jgi:hypothetical protein